MTDFTPVAVEKTNLIPMLDHGYLKRIESWGSDERIVETARMSTQKGFRTWEPYRECLRCGMWTLYIDENPNDRVMCSNGENHDWLSRPKGDENLLKFLASNHHDTPFEFGGCTFETQAPIFVYREWMRHRVPFGYNEMSARYEPLPDTNYIPTLERLMINSGGSNKQAGTVRGASVLTEERALAFRETLRRNYEQDERDYQEALADGIPKELARIHLPVGRYSRMRATGNLRGWLGFLVLRMSPGAQWEIRQYANGIHLMLSEDFPRAMRLFDELRAT